MQDFLDQLNLFMETKGITIIKVLALIVFGLLIIKFINRRMKILAKKTDNPILRFSVSIINVALYILLFLWIARTAGISTTSFITVLGALSLALSLALQDSLSNLANGLIIVTTKPFKEGDHIIIAGNEGNVKEINLFNVKITTFDNQIITIPNKNVTSEAIVNYSIRPTRRIDLTVSAAYGSDIKKVQEVLLDIVSKHSDILKDPAPFVRLWEMADSSLDFKVRVFVSKDKFISVKLDLIEQVYETFNQLGIEIPYTHYDVTIRNGEENND